MPPMLGAPASQELAEVPPRRISYTDMPQAYSLTGAHFKMFLPHARGDDSARWAGRVAPLGHGHGFIIIISRCHARCFAH